ncbi:hypothetical protein Goarm_022564 [Gossypium armourianum]|uniref:Uncharacterized protein n=1 Tax=Gossypium armourianum TaxID=34283 RepID=A0A7J9KIC2_9ROSI|nr:hypothetical protein [Gossypium armourianum]
MVVNYRNNRLGWKLAFGLEERKVTDPTRSRFNILHDFRDGNEINIGDSNPTVLAILKGKGVSIYNKPLSEEDKTDGVLGLVNLNANVSFKKDTISSKAVATYSVGLRIQGLSGLLIRAPSDMSSGASSSSLKFGDCKWLKRGSHNLRGKGSKFKVKALSRESVAKTMSRVVEKIGSDSLIANSNNS